LASVEQNLLGSRQTDPAFIMLPEIKRDNNGRQHLSRQIKLY